MNIKEGTSMQSSVQRLENKEVTEIDLMRGPTG